MGEPDPELYDTCSCHVCATLRSLLATDFNPEVGKSPLQAVPPLLLTTDQAATMLGVTRDVVSQLIGQGELRSVEVLTYGRRRIPRVEIDGYVARLLSGQLRYWVEARAELHQWGLKYMGQKTTYRLKSGSMATRSPRKWHLGDGRSALCGASSEAWEVSGYTVWIRWSKVCDECEVRRDQVRAEKLMKAGTKSRYLGPAELRPMLTVIKHDGGGETIRRDGWHLGDGSVTLCGIRRETWNIPERRPRRRPCAVCQRRAGLEDVVGLSLRTGP